MSGTVSFQSEFFKKLGYAYIQNVLTPSQCEQFADTMLRLKNENVLKYDGEVPNPYYKESYSGNHGDFEAALREVTPRMENELGVKLKPANSYCRVYYNGATLTPHKDRVGLDYTLSITLRTTLDKEWPLWCIDHNGVSVPVDIKVGDGAMMLGHTMTHWRDALVCSPEQYTVQLFMHWGFAE